MNFEQTKTAENLAKTIVIESLNYTNLKYATEIISKNKSINNLLIKISKHDFAHAKIFIDILTKKTSFNIESMQLIVDLSLHLGDIENLLLKIAQNKRKLALDTYTNFARIADEEKQEEIKDIFLNIAKIKAKQSNLLYNYYKKLSNNNLYNPNKEIKYECLNCGYTLKAKSPWKKCPVCNSPQEFIFSESFNIESNPTTEKSCFNAYEICKTKKITNKKLLDLK